MNYPVILSAEFRFMIPEHFLNCNVHAAGHLGDETYVYYHIHRVSKKLCQCYFVNNCVKHWPNLIIFGTQRREET